MTIAFRGGSKDGQTIERDHVGRIILMPVHRAPATGTTEDFTRIDLDEVWGHKSRTPSELECERYRRISYDRHTNTAVYEFDGMESR